MILPHPALAAEVRFFLPLSLLWADKRCPQGLKPKSSQTCYGTGEPVPFRDRVFPMELSCLLSRRHARHTRVYRFAIVHVNSRCIVFVSIYRSDDGRTLRRARSAGR